MPPKADYSQQFKELKDLVQATNDNISALEERITTNHSDLVARMEAVENRSKEALNIAKSNEILINNFEDLLEEKIATKIPDIVKQVKNDLQITKLKGQMKSVLIELQNIRNRSMRDNLIFKDIGESGNEKWENTTQVLADFIHDNLNLGYLFNDIDSQINRVHRASDNNNNGKKNNRKGPRPIIAKFVNWRFAEEIHNRIINLNKTKKLEYIFCNQMSSKKLTLRRNNALINRRDYLQANKNMQVKLEFQSSQLGWFVALVAAAYGWAWYADGHVGFTTCI